MSSKIDIANSGALALREVKKKYGNLPKEAISSFNLSKAAPYFGFVDVEMTNCPPFVLFSNNDDFVAQEYFWNGADAYEPMTLKLWASLAKSSSVIFDIGSYTGVFALSAAITNRKSKVYAFEAIDFIYSRFLVNKVANGLGNIQPYHLAVSDKDGVVEFNIYAGEEVLSTGSTLLEKTTGRSIYLKKEVRCVRLDSLLKELDVSRLDLMKIDAEGAENLIFNGGEEIFRKYRPDVICEFLDGSQPAEIESMLTSMGYRYFHIDDQAMRVDPVERITVGKNKHSLNTLITCKSNEKVASMLAS